MLKKVVVMMLGLLVLNACKKKEEEDEDPLLGDWELKCAEANSPVDIEDTYHRTMTQTYAEDGTVTTNKVMYSGSLCKAADLYITTDIISTWEKGDATATVDGANDIDFVYQKVEMTLHTDALVELFNNGDACGGDFVVDEAKEIEENTDTCPFEANDAKYYDIVKIDDGKLQFGAVEADYDTTTKAKRPIRINDDVELTRP